MQMVNVAVGYSRNHCFDQIPSDSSNRSQILMVDFWTLRFKCSPSGSWISLGSSVNLKRDATVGAIPNSVERLGKEDEGCPTSHSNPLESTHVNMSSCSLEKETVSHSRYLVAPANGDSGSFLFMPTEDSLSLVHSKDMCQEFAENDKFPNQAAGEAVVKVPHGEKTVELVVATSWVCSGNSTGRASNASSVDFKGEFRKAGDSEGPIKGVEEETMGVRKAAHARKGSKRSWTAEVHSLSERRRKDRINEKMCALQELIPNCIKVMFSREETIHRFLVRWLGRPESENAWISRETLQQLDPDLLEFYQSQQDCTSSSPSQLPSGDLDRSVSFRPPLTRVYPRRRRVAQALSLWLNN